MHNRVIHSQAQRNLHKIKKYYPSIQLPMKQKGGTKMAKKSSKYRLPLWLRRARDVGYQFLIPLTIFQLLRTIFFPTTIDVVILAVFVFMYLSFVLDWF